MKFWSMNGGILMVDRTIYPHIFDYLSGKIRHQTEAKKIQLTNGFEYEIATEGESNVAANKPDDMPKKVAVIGINGMIQRNNILNEQGNAISYYGTDYITQYVLHYTKDPSIKAIIIEVNSAGGFSNAVANLIDAIQKFKATGRKVYASVDIACSAGYHLVSFCDYVVANSKASILGCIGTMWTATDYSKMYKKSGIEDVTVIADQTPDKGAEYRQAIQGKPQLLKENIINPTAQVFIDDVKANRKINNTSILKGSALTAEKAIQAGLCDAVMPLSDLIQVAIGDGKVTNTTPNRNTKSSNNQTPTKNNMELNIFSLFSKAKAGDATPTEEGQILSELARYQGIESNLNATIATQNTEIGNLRNQLSAETNAKVEAENKVTELANKVAELEGKLENTAGSQAQTAVLDGNEVITQPTPAETVPGLKDEMESFKARLETKVSGLI